MPMLILSLILFYQPFSAILLLTGPSGSGKTAAIHVLASELNFEVQEWINPVSDNQGVCRE